MQKRVFNWCAYCRDEFVIFEFAINSNTHKLLNKKIRVSDSSELIKYWKKLDKKTGKTNKELVIINL
jgi:hypothetical protein